jgi:hypothetical protein
MPSTTTSARQQARHDSPRQHFAAHGVIEVDVTSVQGKRNLPSQWRVWIPVGRIDLHARLTVAAHGGLAAHQGMRPTLEELARVFYWRGMRDWVRHYIARCVHCRTSNDVARVKRFPRLDHGHGAERGAVLRLGPRLDKQRNRGAAAGGFNNSPYISCSRQVLTKDAAGSKACCCCVRAAEQQQKKLGCDFLLLRQTPLPPPPAPPSYLRNPKNVSLF